MAETEAASFPRLRAGPAVALFAAAVLSACAAPTETRYARLVESYLDAGLLRTDIAPPDAPFDNADLVRNFERIAFFSEFAPIDAENSRLIARATPAALFKWTGPVRWHVDGDGATEADRQAYRALTARISAVTGLEFVETDDAPQIFAMIASRPLREAFVALLARRGALARMRLIEEWARNDLYPCVGQVGASETAAEVRAQAIIVVKAETTGLLRAGCIHEELSQSLGLINDDADARPSIFNDDQEFALLTRHDEYLLRILYDPRLTAGMDAETGMPIVREIVAEIGPDRFAGAPPPPAPPRSSATEPDR